MTTSPSVSTSSTWLILSFAILEMCTHIGKEGEPALTTRSFLVCKYNGLIEIVRSGQEDED